MIVSLDLIRVPSKIRKICDNDKVGLFMSSTFARYMDPYVPEDTGMLKRSVNITVPFEVSYNTDYAKRCYYGTDVEFSKDKSPNATAYWDKAMLDVRRDTIAKEVSDFIERM